MNNMSVAGTVWRIKVSVFISSILCLLLAQPSYSATIMPEPSSPQVFSQGTVATPVLDADPAKAKPIGVGLVASGGSTFSIQIGLPQFSQTVDIYFGIQLPNSTDLYIWTKDNTFKLPSEAASLWELAWKTANINQVSEYPFGSTPIATSLLSKGTYNLYLAVFPQGGLINYNLWSTSFTVGGGTATSGWQRLGGPNGGLGYDIRYNFTDPNTWYVTDANAGVHISTDNGETWLPGNTGIPGQMGQTGDLIPVFCLTVDPHDPQIVWAGTDVTGHIYKSTNAGKSWTRMDTGIDFTGYDSFSFRGFTVDPDSSDIVYAMGELKDSSIGPTGGVWGTAFGGRVYKTTDGGKNWKVIWEGVPPSSLTRYLWIDPQVASDPNDDILYVSTGIFDRGAVGEKDWQTNGEPWGGLGVLRSKDSGKTWEVLGKSNGLELLYIGSLFMDPLNPKILLAASGHIIAGASVETIVQAGRAPGGIYRTTDGGDHWTKVLASSGSQLLEALSAVEICPVPYSNVAYAGSDQAFYRSSDGGLTWAMVAGGPDKWGPPGVEAYVPIDLQCDPRDPNRVFANNYNGGNFLSEDGGKTWTNSSQGYSGAHIRNLAVDPSSPARIYAAARSGMWRSDDGGTAWTGLRYRAAEYNAGLECTSAAVDPGQTNRVLQGCIFGGAIQESTDRGLTWHHIWPPLQNGEPTFRAEPVLDLVFAPSDAKKVYAAFGGSNCIMFHLPCDTGSGVASSSDGGKTWTLSTDADIKNLAAIDLDVSPNDAELVFAATEKGLFKTTDGGTTWSAVSITGVTAGARVRAVAVSPKDPKRILAGVDGSNQSVPVTGGTYLSKDGGSTWETAYSGLASGGSIHHIVFDPTDANNVFLSDVKSGVYRSTDGGKTWQLFNTGLLTREVQPLVITADGKHLYAGTNGSGVYRYDLNGMSP